jgi:nickel-dependent lactate racemase
VGGRPADEIVVEALDRPTAGPPLAELARGRRDAVVVVPDATRRVDLPQLLPALLGRLQAAGVPRSEITVLVACGTHPAAASHDLEDLVGRVPDDVAVVQHDARDPDGMIEIGTGSDRIRLNRLVVEASLVVTVSSVRHHYFAGFGGGPKMIFPGLAAYDRIQSNHALVLRREAHGAARHPGCEPGRLVGNPVAEEISRLADVRPPDAALCTVPGQDGHVAWAAFGEPRAAFTEAVEVARSWYEIALEGSLDLAVVSAGGHPADHTLIQAHKALDSACRFVAPGGELLFVAALGGGGGSPDIEPFLERPEPAEIMRQLEQRWVQYGHTVLRLMDKTSRYRVWLDSDLDRALAERLGFLPVDDPTEVVSRWRHDRVGASVAVMAGEPVYPAVPAAT